MENIDSSSFKFNQERFVLNSLVKADIDTLGLEKADKVQVQAEKAFSVLPHVENKSRVKIVSETNLKIVASSKENNISADYISVKTTAYFKLQADIDIRDSDNNYLRMLLISQANIQTTDIVNQIMSKSELEGSPISYDIYDID